MESVQLLGEEAPLKEVRKVIFGILSPDEILQMSGDLNIESTSTRKSENTVDDPRFGNSDIDCGTCEAKSYTKGDITCPGHFGRIELNVPILNPLYYSTIIMVLKAVCIECSGTLLAEENLGFIGDTSIPPEKNTECRVTKTNIGQFIGMTKLRKVYEYIKKDKFAICPNCGAIQPDYKMNNYNVTHRYTDPETGKSSPWYRLDNNKVLIILKKISNDSLSAIGFKPNNRPENMIFVYLPILPTIDRPFAMKDKEKRDDDLTHLYRNIVLANNQYRNCTKEKDRLLTEERLAKRIHAVIDNTKLHDVQKVSKRPYMSIKQRLSGKEGRLRRTLMGKRTDFCGRSVLTPDPFIPIDTIGLPIQFVLKMTVPVKYFRHNKREIRELFKKRVINIPDCTGRTQEKVSLHGVFSITKEKTGTTTLYEHIAKRGMKVHVNTGDVINRRLKNGDVVVFGRMPSLHKYSMMGFKVKLIPGKTIHVNPCITTPYNADFDGDEGTLNFPQSPEAIVETREILDIKKNLLNVQSNRPTIGAIQDTRVGVFLMTQKNTIIVPEIFNDCAVSGNSSHNIQRVYYIWRKLKGLSRPPANKRPCRSFYTGRNLFSLLLPEDFSYTLKHPEENIVIKYGVLISGIICGKTIGNTKGGIIHHLALYYSETVVADFIANIQTMVCSYILQRGFSIGIEDCIVAGTDISESSIEKMEVQLSLLNKSLSFSWSSGLENRSLEGNNAQSSINEVKKIIALNKAKDIGQSLAKNNINYQDVSLSIDSPVFKMHPNIIKAPLIEPSPTKRNALVDMVKSGSKGNYVNITQIVGLLGQQMVRGSLIEHDFSYSGRTLPHYEYDDTSPYTEGFIKSSFIKGLNPAEFWFHSSAGREGLINKAITTSQTGYLQRRMTKCMEDLVCAYDYTIRAQNQRVVQFVYGGDGISPGILSSVKGTLQFLNIQHVVDRLNCRYELEHDIIAL